MIKGLITPCEFRPRSQRLGGIFAYIWKYQFLFVGLPKPKRMNFQYLRRITSSVFIILVALLCLSVITGSIYLVRHIYTLDLNTEFLFKPFIILTLGILITGFLDDYFSQMAKINLEDTKNSPIFDLSKSNDYGRVQTQKRQNIKSL